MTKQQHQITPPPDLVEQWATEHLGEPVRITNRHSGHYIAAQASDWKLEQVIEQWEDLINSSMTDIQMIREFDKRLKAMRPQEDNS